jgi:pimeloyl-ACP methyl ester carboxylesterase
VLDACGVERAVVIGLSLGARYGLQLAHHDPERVMGLVLIGPALELAPPLAERAMILENLFEPLPPHPQGWVKYNVAYWHAEYRDFVEFFFGQAFSEPHSTKPWEDAAGWALETGPEVLEAEVRGRGLAISAQELLTGITCPTMVIHGTADRIQPHQIGVEAARLSGGTLISIEGAGHIPNVRDPVQVNLAIRRFIERLPR